MPVRKLPKKIELCPIIDAILELRLETTAPSEAFFGVLYSVFGKDFPQITKLPILQLPDAIRETDPSLFFKPHYKLASDKFALQIGPRVLTISSHPVYSGWTEFSKNIHRILDEVAKQKLVKRFTRVGIRYLNFFPDTNIFDQVVLQVMQDGSMLPNRETTVRTVFDIGDIKAKLNMGNSVNVVVNKQKKTGSIIDIDVITDKGLDNLKPTIEKCHDEEKKLFFGLLKETYEKTLHPSY
jgi:uncharacterized protein (TIGR04255 family)